MSSKAHFVTLPKPLGEKYLEFLDEEIRRSKALFDISIWEIHWVHHNVLKQLRELLKNV